MKILIVEDDSRKSDQLASALRELRPHDELVERRSYQSGLRDIMLATPDIVVLDMSMPNYDRSASESGWRTRPFAGRDILREMKRKGIGSKVVVVTQLESFGEPPDHMTLAELKTELAHDFPNVYMGTVYYNPAHSDWKHELAMLIRSLTGSSDD